MPVKQLLEVSQAAKVLKLLGDSKRLTMIKLLDKHDLCVCEFVDIFEATQPAISQHLRKLKDACLVKEARKGQWIVYSINKDSEYYALTQSMLSHVPSQDQLLIDLEASGQRISCD
ncbi:MAG TPA: metalloregulator ArsR/SmtB family transcription factor [Paenisporosarcina sp.]|nr:metalloregulator ArsR/SmtB family transcription factor [Paenisporosarcina sp.]